MASTTPMYQRVGTFILAIFFVVSVVGVVVFYVIADNKQRSQEAAINDAIKQPNKKENNVALTCTSEPSLNYKASPPMKDKSLPNFAPVADIPNLSCVVLAAGSGDAVVRAGDTVTVNYTGALASNGIVFESSLDSGSPATFGLNQVISGWTNGLPGMKVGETRRLLIPSDMAYGAGGSGSIPPNSDLVFDVTLIKIGQ